MTDREWRQIELEAERDAKATLQAEEETPLPPLSQIAWAERGYGGATDRFSSVHRVADGSARTQTTLCGEFVPAPILRVPSVLLRRLEPCRHCELRYTNQAEAA
jgi:hypothetical protein